MALVVVLGGMVGLSAGSAAAATQICAQFGNASIDGGRYVVQNNRWGTAATQCTTALDDGFSLDRADGSVPTNGAPKSYPSIFAGCHYQVCSTGSGLPVPASAVGNASTAVSITTAPGQWDAAYDIWFDTQPNPVGRNDGTEIMIWLNHTSSPQPIGSPQGTIVVGGASWTVWQGNVGWNVVSFVRDQTTTSANLTLKPFVDESVRRGATQPGWYLTSVQFGFEPWVDGAGLAATNFAFDATGATSAPGAPDVTADGKIVGVGSGRCVDVNGSNTASGTTVQLYDCNGTGAQSWTASGGRLINSGSGKCLDVRGGATADGTGVQIWDCRDGNPAQQWQVTATGSIVNPNSGKCLDTSYGGTSNWTGLIIYTCSADKQNQLWR